MSLDHLMYLDLVTSRIQRPIDFPAIVDVCRQDIDVVSVAAIMGIQVIETAIVSLFKYFSFAGFHEIDAKGDIGNIED